MTDRRGAGVGMGCGHGVWAWGVGMGQRLAVNTVHVVCAGSDYFPFFLLGVPRRGGDCLL